LKASSHIALSPNGTNPVTKTVKTNRFNYQGRPYRQTFAL